MAHDYNPMYKKSIQIIPTVCGWDNCKPGQFYGPIARTFWLIHYIESGFGNYKIGNNTYRLGPGNLFIIPPYVETYYEADKENPWTYTWIGFTASGPLPFQLPDTMNFPAAQKIFENFRESKHYLFGRNEYQTAKIWEFFSLLLESDKKVEHLNFVDAASIYIKQHFNKSSLTVGQIADNLNIDRAYFSTIFTQSKGISPRKYIISYRMRTAAELLINHNQSVTVAAKSVGYEDICNFSKAFKSFFGLSPREYIKKHKRSTDF